MGPSTTIAGPGGVMCRGGEGAIPPQIGEEIPTNRRNKSADQFFSKTGSQCPGS